MTKQKPKVLFSTNTLLAYHINEEYYGGLHYVWCSPFLSCEDHNYGGVIIPKSSSPINIYHEFCCGLNDLHSTIIPQNCLGLKKGAVSYFNNNVITDIQKNELFEIIKKAKKENRQLFKPLLYIIPYTSEIEAKLKPVSVGTRAGVLSPEFIIPNLTSKDFYVANIDKTIMS